MKKIIFRYSAMNAGKSANLIMTYHNYTELGRKALVVVPDSSKTCKVYSRNGMTLDAIKIKDIKQKLEEETYECILVDEVQFLDKEQIMYLNELNLKYNITIICYGLRTTSSGELFEGSGILFGIADEIEELPTLCYCGKKARMNLRAVDGKVDKSKTIIKLRELSNIAYISLCRECHNWFYNSDSDISFLVDNFDNTKKTKK